MHAVTNSRDLQTHPVLPPQMHVDLYSQLGGQQTSPTWHSRYTSAGAPPLSVASLSAKNAAESVRCFAKASCTKARSLHLAFSLVIMLTWRGEQLYAWKERRCRTALMLSGVSLALSKLKCGAAPGALFFQCRHEEVSLSYSDYD
jgi:hypothetical protein